MNLMPTASEGVPDAVGDGSQRNFRVGYLLRMWDEKYVPWEEALISA